MAEKSMDEMLQEIMAEKEGGQKEEAPVESTVQVEPETVVEGTSASVDEESNVAMDRADAERPKPVPKKNRRGSKAMQAELEKTKILADENREKYQRLLAEFDNVRARYDKENKKMHDQGTKDTILKLLPVVDNLERALEFASKDGSDSAFIEGVEKIYKQLMDTLLALGAEPMNAVGKQFDPTFHNAVMHVEDDTLEENIILEEMQKGYMFKDTVLRHSMVKVAN